MSADRRRRGVVVAVVAAMAALGGLWIVSDSRGRPPKLRDRGPTSATREPTLATAPARHYDGAPPPGTDTPPPPPPPAAEVERVVVEGIVVRWVDGSTPVAGATVTISGEHGDWPLAPPVTTDDRGRFRVEGVPAARTLVVTARVDGHVPKSLRVERGTATRDLRIEIPPGGAVEGTVTDGDGRPMAGVRVFVVRSGEHVLPREQVDSETDVSGRYAVRGITVGKDRVVVAQASDLLEGRSEPFAIGREGDTVTRDVRVPKPASLRIVVEGLGARPPSSVQLELKWELGGDTYLRLERDALGADGTWIGEKLTPGTYQVIAFVKDSPFTTAKAVLVEGERAEVTVRLPAGLLLEGVVVTEAGEPVWFASVIWEGPRSALTSTGPDGRFRFDGLDARAGRLSVDGHGRPHMPGERSSQTSAKTTLEGVVPGGPPIRVVLPASPVVVGRIEGVPDGARIRSVVLTADLSSGHGPEPLGPDGAFSVPTSRIGTPALVVLRVGEAAPLVIEVPPLAAGRRHDVGTLRVDPGRTLLVDVRDEGGKPVAGATVTIADKWAEQRFAKTGADGRAAFDAMPARGAEVTVRAEGFPLHVVMLAPPGSVPASVVVGKGGILEGTVFDASGKPAAGAHLSVRPAGEYPYDTDFDSTRQHMEADAEGRFRGRLQARAYRLTALDADWKHKTPAEIVVVQGTTTNVEVRLR